MPKISGGAKGPLPPKQDASTSASPDVAAERLGTPQVQQITQTQSLLSPAAIYLYRQARWTPISSLTPQNMADQMGEWNVGTMRRFSLTMDAVERRDPLVRSVTSKLKMAVSRRDYEIVKVQNADESMAEAHAQALEYFYANLSCTNAIDRNQIGGVHTLLHQMMDAQLKGYAVHEIVWKIKGEMLTACFCFVPLWFFENRTGSLRFCGNFAWDGIPLKDGQWMVTMGDGIMESVCAAWMYKTLCLRDWLIYSERNGMPMPVAHLNAAPGTDAYNKAVEVLNNIGPDQALIVGPDDKVDKVEFGASGQLPQPLLVEYMDKVISAVCRGADLGTLSSGQGVQGTGASLQAEEGDMIEVHCGNVLTETLNHFVDRQVIKWHFGEEAEPLAYFKLNLPKRQDLNLEIAVDKFLLECGARLGVDEAMERYGRTQAEEDEETLTAPAKPASPFGAAGGSPFKSLFGENGNGNGNGRPKPKESEEEKEEAAEPVSAADEFANASPMMKAFVHRALARMAKDTSEAVKPLRDKLKEIAAMQNGAQMQAALRYLLPQLPGMLKEINRDPANALALRDIAGAMILNGVTGEGRPR